MTNHRPIVLTEKDKLRFWEKVVQSEFPDDCWTWNAWHFQDGYPGFSIGYQNHRVNRVMYVIVNGSIPEGRQINHGCDNKKCINPKHLHAGTQLSNMHEMAERGRKVVVVGEGLPQHKLNTKQVIEIRRRYALGDVTQTALAKEFGVSRRAIGFIVTGQRWAHLLEFT